MKFILQPWHLAFVLLSALVNQRQQQIIEFQNTQIEALLKKLGKKRVLLNDDQRRLLAVKGKALGRKALMELTTIVTRSFANRSATSWLTPVQVPCGYRRGVRT